MFVARPQKYKNVTCHITNLRTKKKLKKYLKYIPIILTLILFTYFYIYKYVYINNQHFYRGNIHAKIIKIENYQNKSIQFYYDDKYCITTTDTKNDTLKIGDSISKKSQTAKFDVFRKLGGKYQLYKSY